MDLKTEWLGRIGYRATWDRQHQLVAARAAGGIPDTLLLLEHDPVLTLGRHADPSHVLAPPERLAERGIDVLQVERGGEVTYHGPGQLVAYPIIRLADRGLLLRPFVRALEGAMTDTAASYGVPADRRDGYPGCWTALDTPFPRKLGALGLRVERGVSYHGIALNITTDLADFGLIDPCGMTGLTVTSMARELGWSGDAARPDTAGVEEAGRRFEAALRVRLEAAIRDGPRAATAATAARGPADAPVPTAAAAAA